MTRLHGAGVFLCLSGNILLFSGIYAQGRFQPPAPKAPAQMDLMSPATMRYVPGMDEALVATGPVTDEECKDLAVALAAFREAPAKAGASGDFDDYAKPLLTFLDAHPKSNWNASLYLNIGLGYYRSGYYSRTINYFEKSWQLGRNATNIESKRVADRALGELAEMHARLGHAAELKELFAQVGDRPVSGSAQFLMQGAHDGLSSFIHRPEVSYLCGPAALRNILLTLKAGPDQIKVADEARSGEHGFSLSQLAELADKAGLRYGLIYRSPGQPVPVPSIINWNVHHYAAIVEAHDGHYRLIDPTFGGAGSVVTERAADEEGSGYYLVPAEILKSHSESGWRTIAANSAEAHAVYGMGNTFNYFPGGCGKCGDQTASQGGSTPSQMTIATAKLAEASLTLSDTPVGYLPQKGIPARVTIKYNAQDGDQPGTFSFSNVGHQWAHNWQAYIKDDPNNPGSNVVRIIGGGGGYDYNIIAQLYQNIYNSTTGNFVPEVYDNSQLVRVPATGPAKYYVRNLPDGGKETYALSNGATTAPRIMFLTSVSDPAGNETTLQYDNIFRLISVTDAMGRKTIFSYLSPLSQYLITKISDPFGRFSTLKYDSQGRLSSITDPIGITSSFTYGNNGETDFVTALTTPYGTSKFSDRLDPNISRTCCVELSIAMTDPLGHVEYAHLYQNQRVTGTGPEAVVPAGMQNDNPYLMWRNTYYWNAHEAASGGVTTDAAGNPTGEDFAKADIYHWFHQCCTINYVSNQLGSHKRPLEKYREWYNTEPIYNTGYYSGALDYPTLTGRVLDDGSTQLSGTTYNSFGLPLTRTDEMGRFTEMTYAANDIDLLTVKQLVTPPSGFQTIATFGSYNALHKPQTLTGPDGKEWKYSYNAAGQPLTVTDPNGGTTTYSYDSLGRLSTVENANSKVVSTLTYDAADRIQTRADSEGYKLTYEYDNLDRVTSIIYPDGSTDAYDYTFQTGLNTGKPSLDLRRYTDRLGRVTTYDYDADRRLVSVTQPEANGTHITTYSYYEDGTLKEITDPNGNVTHWNIDLQSRPTSKTYAFGTSEVRTETYAYEATNSRLHSITDALDQVKTLTYAHDNRVTGIAYANAVNPTPDVSFVWGNRYPHLISMSDGTGTTHYAYYSPGSTGGLKLAWTSGPFVSNSTIYFSYDALGRLSERKIPGGNESFGYDAISRLVSHGTPLGTFAYTYLGQTEQVTSRKVTNGTVSIGTAWTYDTNENDRRLINIANSGVSRSYALSYAMPGGGGASNPYDILNIKDIAAAGHPFASQDHVYGYDAIDRLMTATAAMPGNSTYAYDQVDNIKSLTDSTGTTGATYNSLNELVTWGSRSYDYDGNGNTLSGDGVHSYKWDAENRLIEIDYAGSNQKSQFAYDGMGRRLVDTETAANGQITTARYLWCGSRVCQTSNDSDAVLRRDLPEGEYLATNGQKFLYIQDQLGSVRDVLDASTGARVKSDDYTPYGAITQNNGPAAMDYGFARLFSHPESALNLAAYRAQDGVSGRWINRDPIAEAGGINLFEYVNASPNTKIDPRGLLEVFGFGGGTLPVVNIPGGTGNVEFAPIYYYNSDDPSETGWGSITAVGVDLGHFIGIYKGQEEFRNGQKECITFYEAKLQDIPVVGVFVPRWIPGLGYYTAGEQYGLFFFKGGDIFGGVGFPISGTWSQIQNSSWNTSFTDWLIESKYADWLF